MLVDNRTDWLKARRKGIGGSDAASVLGISPWKSNVQLWEEKTGIAEPEDISDKEAVRFGKESEAAIRRLFELDFPQFHVDYDEFGMKANEPDCPFIFATLDGELKHCIVNLPEYGGGCFIECDNCTYAISGDDVMDALRTHNARPAPPIGRCGECRHCVGVGKNQALGCTLNSFGVEFGLDFITSKSFCSYFEPREESR